MPSAGIRCAALWALAGTVVACSNAGENSNRALPTRPGAPAPAAVVASSQPAPTPAAPLAGKKFGTVDYVTLPGVASHLGLQLSWLERGRKAVLTAPGCRAELEIDTRDITVNGLRVFLGSPVIGMSGQLAVSRIDFERCLAPMLRPGFATNPPALPRIIAIDPGHGGADDGTENRRLGLKEKVLTLDVALRLKRLLETAGYQVVMTRDVDKDLSTKKDVDLPMRAEIANRAHADLFVSIHFNAAPVDTHGTEVYTYAPARQHATAWWSELRKNDDIDPDGVPVNRYDHWSVVFAQSLHHELLSTLKTEDRGKKVAHWAVLKNLECPGVLVEPAIISNEAEAKRVAQPAFRQGIAEAIAAGVRDYAATVEAVRAKRGLPSATSRRHRSSHSS
jgi:N-acetylmuramoyl-L-alanine amidase